MLHEKALRALTHTARMQKVVAGNPEHPRGAEYQTQIPLYATLWKSLSVEEREEVASAAADVHDMTPELVAAAIAALES